MTHPLDRPVWSALTTRQAPLATGDAQRGLRYAPGYHIFAAAADASPDSLAELGRLNAEQAALGLGGLGLIEVETNGAPSPLPPGVGVASAALCVQMLAASLTATARPAPAYEPLGEEDAAQMLALATLTKPGPFFEHTHRLGDFIGVKQDGKLIAMAGERMKPDGFTEVSGVCTHPDHRGQGYAAALMRIVAARILERGETPFLHAYAAHEGTIGLYQSLGFEVRAQLMFTVLDGGAQRAG